MSNEVCSSTSLDSSSNDDETKLAYDHLVEYLDAVSSSFSEAILRESDNKPSRVMCCGTSRCMYCPECYQILVPTKYWPEILRQGKLRLPFDNIHLILDDRRTSATGIQSVAVVRASEQMAAASKQKAMEENISTTGAIESVGKDQGINTESICTIDASDDKLNESFPDEMKSLSLSSIGGGCSKIQLFDVDRKEPIPDYAIAEKEKIDDCDGENFSSCHAPGSVDEGTYLLFPGPTSVPLSSIVAKSKIKTLVLLDCKWTRSSIRLRPSIAALPRVHLTSPPKQSLYWRWHNAGSGMLSTAEAIYFAAWEAAGEGKSRNDSWALGDRKDLVHLLWLFGLQRALINNTYRTNPPKNADQKQYPIPFTEHGKEYQRALRRKQDHNRTHGKEKL